MRRLGTSGRARGTRGHRDAFEVEGSLVYYIKAPQVVLKLRQGWLYQRAPSDPDVPLPFVAGRTNVTTLQLNLIF